MCVEGVCLFVCMCVFVRVFVCLCVCVCIYIFVCNALFLIRYSTMRGFGEILLNGYACLPGAEFVLSVRGSVPHDTSLKAVEEVVFSAVKGVVNAAMTGNL